LLCSLLRIVRASSPDSAVRLTDARRIHVPSALKPNSLLDRTLVGGNRPPKVTGTLPFLAVLTFALATAGLRFGAGARSGGANPSLLFGSRLRSPFDLMRRLANFCRAVAVGATATRLRIAVAGQPMLGKALKRAGVPSSRAVLPSRFGRSLRAKRRRYRQLWLLDDPASRLRPHRLSLPHFWEG
jgi:hypothetical protein